MFDDRRAGIVRTLSVFFIIWCLWGPVDSSLLEFKSFMDEQGPLNRLINRVECLFILKMVLTGVSLVLLKWPTNLFLSFLQIVLGSLLLYSGLVSGTLWNYNTHILVIAILTFLALVRSDKGQAQKDLVTAVSLVFATIYFQAAISKLVVSGLEWMTSGLSIYTHMNKFNPKLSVFLDGNHRLFQAAGWLTVIGELILGSLFVVPKTRKLAATLSITFHLMLWLTFNISFWHLWIFYPAVYFEIGQLQRLVKFLVDKHQEIRCFNESLNLR